MDKQFDLSVAVDELFADACPDEILGEWKDWGCAQFAPAGFPLMTEFKPTVLPFVLSDVPVRLLVSMTTPEAHPHLAALREHQYCLKFVFPAANCELALAA